MTDRRSFDLPGDNAAAEALLEAARGYRAPLRLRRRVEESLGIPQTVAAVASSSAAAAGAATATGGKTLLMALALATAGLAGGGWIAYRGGVPSTPSLTASSTPAVADPVVVPATAPRPGPVEPWPVHTPAAAVDPGSDGVGVARTRNSGALSAAKVRRPTAARAKLRATATAGDFSGARPSPAAVPPRGEDVGQDVGQDVGEDAVVIGAANTDVRRNEDSIVRKTMLEGAPEQREVADAEAAAAPGQLVDRAAVSPPPTALAAEVELLSRAQTLARQHRHHAVMTLLSEHDRRFPRGALVEEAEVMRISALFALDRTAVAEDRAQQFLERHGDGVLGQRIRTLLHRTARNP